MARSSHVRCRRTCGLVCKAGWPQNGDPIGASVVPPSSDTLLLYVSIAIALVVAWRARVRVTRRRAQRRMAGYELMDCLKAYTAWIDWHRDEPLLHQNPEELAIPAVLAQAVRIKDAHFPELAPLMVQLLQTHGELMQYLWEQNILRMTHSDGMLSSSGFWCSSGSSRCQSIHAVYAFRQSISW
jgi:hypothetical protein